MDESEIRGAGSRLLVPRRTLLKGAGAAGLSGVIGAPFINRLKAMEAHPLAGKKIEMNILGIAGWLPSSLGVKMSPLFADYVKQRYGYDVSFGFAEAPFGDLFQKAATSLATKSQEYKHHHLRFTVARSTGQAGLDPEAQRRHRQEPGPATRLVLEDGGRHLHALPRRQPGHLGSAAGRRRLRALPSQGHAGRSERTAGLPGQIQHETADHVRGIREAQRGRLRKSHGILHPSREGDLGCRLAVLSRLRLLHLSAVLHQCGARAARSGTRRRARSRAS